MQFPPPICNKQTPSIMPRIMFTRIIIGFIMATLLQQTTSAILDCLIELKNSPPPIQTHVRDAYPNPQRWSRIVGYSRLLPSCSNNDTCFHEHGRTLEVLDLPPQSQSQSQSQSQYQSQPYLLSSSRWSKFFQSSHHDEFYATPMTTPLPPATCHHFNSPVYVVNLLTWQVGHLLIDILEPLFNMIINDHPNNKNATANHIFIQVAHPAENAILQHLIARDLYTDSVDSPFSLLTKLSDNVVKPFAALDSDFECVTFEEINLEVDVCNTYYSVGHDKNIANDELVENYARLRQFLTPPLPLTLPLPLPPPPRKHNNDYKTNIKPSNNKPPLIDIKPPLTPPAHVPFHTDKDPNSFPRIDDLPVSNTAVSLN